MLPDWDYRFWDDSGVEKLMNEEFPQYLDAYQEIKQGIVRADIARCAFLHRYGGYYVDTDYKFFKPIGEDYLDRACVLPIEEKYSITMDGVKLGNAIMGSVAGYHFWKGFIDDIFQRLSSSDSSARRGQPETFSGPHALTAFYFQNKEDFSEVVTPAQAVFFPLLTMRGFRSAVTNHTIGMHLCYGSWRRKEGMQKFRNLVRRKITAIT